jgi:TolB protein
MKVLFLLLLSLAACQSLPKYELAFVSDRDGSLDIYLTDGEARRFTRLTHTLDTEYGLSWSPDGKQLLYADYGPETQGLRLLQVESGTIDSLPIPYFKEHSAHFSPDGKQIVFASSRDHPAGELYLLSLANGQIQRLTYNSLQESGCVFHPDGKQILFSRQTTAPDSGQLFGEASLMLLNLQSQQEQQLTQGPAFDGLPSYAPDGQSIAFHRCHGDSCNIMVANADGSQARKLTQGPGDHRWPRWSPDGLWLVYTRLLDQHTDIWIMRPNGQEKQPLIHSSHREEIAVFRPWKTD